MVDPLSFAALTGFIAFATYFFQVQIEMSMLMMAKRKKRSTDFLDLILNQGKQFSQLLSLLLMKQGKKAFAHSAARLLKAKFKRLKCY